MDIRWHSSVSVIYHVTLNQKQHLVHLVNVISNPWAVCPQHREKAHQLKPATPGHANTAQTSNTVTLGTEQCKTAHLQNCNNWTQIRWENNWEKRKGTTTSIINSLSEFVLLLKWVKQVLIVKPFLSAALVSMTLGWTVLHVPLKLWWALLTLLSTGFFFPDLSVWVVLCSVSQFVSTDGK